MNYPTYEAYVRNTPAKRMAAGTLFVDQEGRVLLLHTAYKERWTIPGGNVEAGESPRAAAIRENSEEIGLDTPDIEFICVDYMTGNERIPENLQFMFWGGVLDETTISKITLDTSEVDEFRFVPAEKTTFMVSKGLSKRIILSLQLRAEQRTSYLENGVELREE